MYSVLKGNENPWVTLSKLRPLRFSATLRETNHVGRNLG
jgi:hypothetical protein